MHIDLAARHHVDFVALSQQQQIRVSRIGHQRVHRVTNRNAQAAISNAAQPFGASGGVL